MHMKIVYCLLVLHVRTYLFFCLTPGKWHPPISFSTLYYLRVAPAKDYYTVLCNSASSYLTFGLSRFIRMSGSWIEYLALIWNLMTPTSKTQPDPHMQRCHAPLPPSATIQLIYGLLLFARTWRDDTKNRKNASSQGFCTPGCHLCYHHNSDESSTFWKYDFQII